MVLDVYGFPNPSIMTEGILYSLFMYSILCMYIRKKQEKHAGKVEFRYYNVTKYYLSFNLCNNSIYHYFYVQQIMLI